jgi:hypothetical protein
MAESRTFATLADRTTALLVNTAIFYLVFVVAANRWLPTGGLESVWLLSAFALWFLTLVSAPWFVPPKDAITNGIGALCILVTSEFDAVQKFKSELVTLRWIAVAYCLVVIGMACYSLFSHEKNPIRSRLAYRLTSIFGRGELLYTPPALLSIIGAYQENYLNIAWIVILWVVFIVAKPVEILIAARKEWKADATTNLEDLFVGTIERIDHPNIVRIRLKKIASWKQGSLHVAALSDGDQQFVLALFAQVQGAEVMGTGLCVAGVAESECLKAISGHCLFCTGSGSGTDVHRKPQRLERRAANRIYRGKLHDWNFAVRGRCKS